MQSINLALSSELSTLLKQESLKHNVSVEEVIRRAMQEHTGGDVYIMELEDGSVFVKASESPESFPMPSIQPVKLLALLCTSTKDGAQSLEQALHQLAEKGSMKGFLRGLEHTIRLKRNPLLCDDEELIWEQVRAYERWISDAPKVWLLGE